MTRPRLITISIRVSQCTEVVAGVAGYDDEVGGFPDGEVPGLVRDPQDAGGVAGGLLLAPRGVTDGA